jgi:hypothetical protein
MEAKRRLGGSSAGFTCRHTVQGSGNSDRDFGMLDTELDSTARSLVADLEIEQTGRPKPIMYVEY